MALTRPVPTDTDRSRNPGPRGIFKLENKKLKKAAADGKSEAELAKIVEKIDKTLKKNYEKGL
jgi:hypothetical protein